MASALQRGCPPGGRVVQYPPWPNTGVRMRKLLLIDDDEKLAEPLREYFDRYELSLDNETHPLRGIERIRNRQYDLVVLDVMLPEIDGFETCRRIRQFSDIPILMLTARGEVMDRVVGLELGADDYLPKPFEPRELVARIQNIFRRGKPVEAAIVYELGELRVDTARKSLTRGDEEIAVTATEYELLSLLLRNQDRVLSRDEIMRALRGMDADIYSRAIDVLISRLRQKLQRPELIRTVRGQGYQLVNR
ncbi:MAG TPA: response regulator transcription factor [Gammaproteobacteria bacterium]|nr:response regulator transcription factor [Gammaproteobacteria bacterium]